MVEVILVTIGVFQEYIKENIKQLLSFGIHVTVILDPEFIVMLKEFEDITVVSSKVFDMTFFDGRTKLDNIFRGGFWNSASKRLFYVYEYIKKFNKQNVFHIENDVLLYHPLTDLIQDTSKVWLAMDSPKRCIPSIIFIPNFKVIEPLILNYNFSKNDMENMSNFFWNNRELCNTFPIIIKNPEFPREDIFNKHSFGGIFDAAAIGQYLGGVDPKNIPGDTRGFINETCVVNYSKYQFIWKVVDNKKLPYIIIENIEYPIFNLHIHSKALFKYIS